MAENENLASILVKSGLISIFTNSPMGYFSKFANDWRITRQIIVAVLSRQKTALSLSHHHSEINSLSIFLMSEMQLTHEKHDPSFIFDGLEKTREMAAIVPRSNGDFPKAHERT